MLVVLLVGCATASADSKYWTYGDPAKVSLFNDGTIEIQTIPTPKLVIGDISYPSAYCSNNGYVCIKSEDFSFAVPLDISDEIRSWDIDGLHFDNIGNRKLDVFGKIFNVFYIEFKMENMTYTFIFSTMHGLLGIKGTGALFDRTLLLMEGSCGFGASKDCK